VSTGSRSNASTTGVTAGAEQSRQIPMPFAVPMRGSSEQVLQTFKFRAANGRFRRPLEQKRLSNIRIWCSHSRHEDGNASQCTPSSLVNAGTITNTAHDACGALGILAAARVTLRRALCIDSVRRTAVIFDFNFRRRQRGASHRSYRTIECRRITAHNKHLHGCLKKPVQLRITAACVHDRWSHCKLLRIH